MQWVDINVSYCPDSPENWVRFEAMKASIIRRNGRAASAGFESTYSPPEGDKKPKSNEAP